jgi:MinD-like ATPase involved in chromosome partitioning or flagellar assembly
MPGGVGGFGKSLLAAALGVAALAGFPSVSLIF